MKELGTTFIFIEADQAIYTKILHVMFSLKDKGENLFPTIIPRMGMCMLRTIYSLFKRCGYVTTTFFSRFERTGNCQKSFDWWGRQRGY